MRLSSAQSNLFHAKLSKNSPLVQVATGKGHSEQHLKYFGKCEAFLCSCVLMRQLIYYASQDVLSVA